MPAVYTDWTPSTVIDLLKAEIVALESTGWPADAQSLHVHFLATASIQEIAIANGWSDRYMELALKVDTCIAAFM